MADIEGRLTQLEEDSLAAKIEKIERRTQQLEDERDAETGSLAKLWELITKNLGVSLSILAAACALWFELDRFAHERSQRQKLQVTTQLVTLLKQLNTGDDTERRTAAVGLSLIGKEAIPVLIENLDFNLDTSSRGTTIESLNAIILRTKNPWLVLDPLLRSTEAVFNRDLSRPNEEITVSNLEAYLVAMASLTAPHQARLSMANRKRIVAAANVLKERVKESESLNDGEKLILNPWLENLRTQFG